MGALQNCTLIDLTVTTTQYIEGKTYSALSGSLCKTRLDNTSLIVCDRSWWLNRHILKLKTHLKLIAIEKRHLKGMNLNLNVPTFS
jgi:hypothetical protein